MNSLLRKAWLIFYIIIFSGLFTLLITSYLKYHELEHHLKSEQYYTAQLFNSHISSAFSQFDTLLDLINYEYSFQKSLEIDVIDNILLKDPLLVGFAFFAPDGSLKSTSSSLKIIKNTNFLKNNETSQWFAEALNQNKMTIGAPYYIKTLKKWTIPIYKRIVNLQGEVVGVIASGLDLQALSTQLNDEKTGQRILQAVLGNGHYRVLRANVAHNKYEKIYSFPVLDSSLKEAEEKVSQQGLSSDKLRKSGEAVQIEIHLQDNKHFVTILFNRQYGIWINAIESNYSLQQKFIPQFTYYSLFYSIFLVVIYLLFKWIVRIEKNKISELTYRADHDILTGLYNRSVLKNRNLKYYKRKKPFTLIYLDLDHFRGINDSYGYSHGDAILIEVSKRINDILAPKNGTIIRFSADEFVLLIDCTEKRDIEECCYTLLNSINSPYIINNDDIRISVSIGIAQSPKNAKDIDTLINYANSSMLIAKKDKNHFVFFSEEIHQQLIKDIEIEQTLHNALAKNEISLVYQPQLCNAKQLCGVEALVRWNNDSLGEVPPDQFIPIAEEIGLMPELGAFIMNKAMAEISALQNKKKIPFQLSINVSARQFVKINFFDNLMNCLACYKSPYLKITIEITESLFIENIDRLLPIFEKMKSENISLSLDDFGTGYSSLSMLRNVPIDELKIDKSFVDHIVSNKKDHAMAASIIAMGKKLGMTVLAEGVEDKQQVDILQSAGCDIYQGYYFSKPLNLADLDSYINTL